MDQDTREVRDQVEEARERVGDTVEALAYKANAPRRFKDDARRRLIRTRQRITSHPQIARLRQASARSATENGPAAATPGPAVTDAPSLRQRAQPAINAATRVPPAVGAAAGCGLLLGVLFGRAIGRGGAR